MQNILSAGLIYSYYIPDLNQEGKEIRELLSKARMNHENTGGR